LFASNHERALIYAFPFVIVAALGLAPRERLAALTVPFRVAAVPLFPALHLFSNVSTATQLALAVVVALSPEVVGALARRNSP